MGLFEAIAATDLRFRLVLAPAAIVFSFSMVGGVALFGEDDGTAIGAAAGAVLAVAVAYAIAKRLA